MPEAAPQQPAIALTKKIADTAAGLLLEAPRCAPSTGRGAEAAIPMLDCFGASRLAMTILTRPLNDAFSHGSAAKLL
jgi:hypothetical protein